MTLKVVLVLWMSPITKVHLLNCLADWKGQFQGEKGYPTIGLKAVANYNLWFWHSAFGFVGTLSDINIWDQSPLYESMIDGSYNKIDFPYVINDEHSEELYDLVDGIYQLLSCFLVTINDLSTKLIRFYMLKQE